MTTCEAPNVDAQDPWVAAGKTHGMFGREPAEEHWHA